MWTSMRRRARRPLQQGTRVGQMKNWPIDNFAFLPSATALKTLLQKWVDVQPLLFSTLHRVLSLEKNAYGKQSNHDGPNYKEYASPLIKACMKEILFVQPFVFETKNKGPSLYTEDSVATARTKTWYAYL